MDRLSHELRAALGPRSHRQAAALLGVNQSTVTRLLAGHLRPGPTLTRKLLAAWPHLGGAILERYTAPAGTQNGPPGDGSRGRHSSTRGMPRVQRGAEEGDAAG